MDEKRLAKIRQALMEEKMHPNSIELMLDGYPDLSGQLLEALDYWILHRALPNISVEGIPLPEICGVGKYHPVDALQTVFFVIQSDDFRQRPADVIRALSTPVDGHIMT